MTPHDNRVTSRDTSVRAAPGDDDPSHVRELRGMLGALDGLGYDLEALLR